MEMQYATRILIPTECHQKVSSFEVHAYEPKRNEELVACHQSPADLLGGSLNGRFLEMYLMRG